MNGSWLLTGATVCKHQNADVSDFLFLWHKSRLLTDINDARKSLMLGVFAIMPLDGLNSTTSAPAGGTSVSLNLRERF